MALTNDISDEIHSFTPTYLTVLRQLKMEIRQMFKFIYKILKQKVMKQKIVLLFYSVLLLVLTFSTSCRPTVVVAVTPACTDEVSSEIFLNTTFLGFCGDFFEGSQQPMKIEVTIDGLSFDTTTKTATVSFRTFETFNRNNNDNNNGSVFRPIPIKLPRCGSYVITVVVRGTDASCFKCCNGNDPSIGGNNACQGTSTTNRKGAPRFRAVSILINSDLALPPPPRVDLKPLSETCSNCGC